MAETLLPQQINILREVEQGTQLSGAIQMADMSRLLDMLAEPTGEVQIDLNFGKDAEGVKYVKGHIHCELQLTCQRCLKSVGYVIDEDINLSPVLSDGQAKQLPAQYEALMVDRDGQELLPIIEDEIILRLPIVAMHNTDLCHAKTVNNQESSNKGKKPFADELAKLKAK